MVTVRERRNVLKTDKPAEHHRERTVPNSDAEREPLKDTEMALVSELISNSRRSDRELARAIGVSQPTVSRIMKRLENEGVVNEYTMIPDFGKLGITCAHSFS